jgi:hypothetical protein
MGLFLSMPVPAQRSHFDDGIRTRTSPFPSQAAHLCPVPEHHAHCSIVYLTEVDELEAGACTDILYLQLLDLYRLNTLHDD